MTTTTTTPAAMPGRAELRALDAVDAIQAVSERLDTLLVAAEYMARSLDVLIALERSAEMSPAFKDALNQAHPQWHATDDATLALGALAGLLSRARTDVYAIEEAAETLAPAAEDQA